MEMQSGPTELIPEIRLKQIFLRKKERESFFSNRLTVVECKTTSGVLCHLFFNGVALMLLVFTPFVILCSEVLTAFL